MGRLPIVRWLVGEQPGVAALQYGIVAIVLGLLLVPLFGRLGGTIGSLFAQIGAAI